MSNNNKKQKTGVPEEEEISDPNLKEMIAVQDELDDLEDKEQDEMEKEIEKIKNIFSPLKQQVFNKRNVAAKKIPKFWATTFLSYPIFDQIFTENDKKVVQHLSDFVVIDDGEKSTYKFTFNANPFFTNTTIQKTYSLSPDGLSVETSTYNLKDKFKFDENEDFFGFWFQSQSQAQNGLDEIADRLKDIWQNPVHVYLGNAPDELLDEEGEYDDDEDGGEQ